MSDKEIISAIKYVSRMKPEFFLSEIRDYVKSDTSVGQIFDVIQPSLYDIGLKATPLEGDFKVTRMPPSKPLVLGDREIGRQETFFKSPGVPSKLERIVEKYVEKKTDKAWDDPSVLEKIRKAIVAQKAAYWKEGEKRHISYETGYSVLGYLAYQFPVYFAQFEHILYGLAKDGLLKTRMKVLDVGTGPGVVPLAIIDFYRRLGDNAVKIYAVEKFDEHIEAYMSLVPEYNSAKPGVEVERPIKADILQMDMDRIPDRVDLIVFSNVLNELHIDIEKRADIVIEFSKKLAPDGNIIIIEPADKANSMEMRKTIVALMGRGLGVYSPCSFIWCAQCRPTSCWSFEEKEDIKPTRLMEAVAKCDEPYRYLNTDIKYSYAILRNDGLTRQQYRVPLKAHFARFSKLKMHVDRRINVVSSKMSGDLGDKKNHVFKVCDGTAVKPVYAVVPHYHVSAENEALLKAPYGEVLEMDGVVARYNKEYDAYNLLVTRNTKISKAGE